MKFFETIGKILSRYPSFFVEGVGNTLIIAAFSVLLGTILGTLMAVMRMGKIAPLRWIAVGYIEFIRGTPLLVQLFVVFYGLPSLGIILDPFPAAVIVFSINEGAYCAETMRAALESVPVGQMEAGYCVGMSYLQVMRRIVLPQALRTAFPPLSNSLIAMVKDTSLAANITVTEMFMATQKLVAYYYEPMALYIEVGVIYLIFSTVLTWVQRWGEKKLSAYGAQKE